MTISNSLVTNTGTDVVTATGGNIANVFLIFCNTSTSVTASLTVYVIPSGGSVNDTTTVIKNLSIEPTDSFAFNIEKFLLSTGDKIRAVETTGNIVSCTASYISI